MKRTLIAFAITLAVVGCKVKETGRGTYQVETPTAEETATATAEAAQQTREAGQDIKEGAQELGAKIKQETREFAQTPAGQEIQKGAQTMAEGAKQAGRGAAQATGTALENAGKNIQEHAKPGDQ
jgi:hypothetical protein